MNRKQRAAFIKMGSFSHINASLIEILTNNFPEFEIDVIDISEVLSKKNPLIYFHCLKEYGMDLLSGKKKISAIRTRTPYVFNMVRQAMLAKLADRNYGFTFQSQSVFDLSLPGVPHFVYTDHTHLANLQYPGFKRERLLSRAWIDCEKEIYRNASLNFSMSSNISRSMIEDYGCAPDTVACVYCGANVQAKEDDVFDDSRFAKKNILFVGVDWQRKGGPVLVEAFRTVLETYPDATLTIVGCNPDIELPNCQVVGRIPLPEVKKYFEQASVFCLPTTLEPFGIVFLEAMAHKLPIIASNIGAIPDFVFDGSNGYKVEPNDPHRLARRLIEMVGSPERCKSFGEYGHRLFWDRYTWKKTGERIREKIEPLLR
ncbi:MAG: glycosyltransferase family 4 protein [Gammaproteobacteria bacterium]